MRRRAFLKNLGILSSLSWFSVLGETTASPLSRFKLGAISDGFSQDFEEALKMMKGFGLSWVEVRVVWGVYNTEASPEQVRRIKDLLKKYDFRVSVLDTALYKCALPGTQPMDGTKDIYPYSQQLDLLKRAIERAQALGTDKLRGFTFWRVTEPEKYAQRIAEEVEKAAEVARSGGMRLLIENEGACNVATGHELARLLKSVPAANLGVNWDVGNGFWRGEVSFPEGYRALDKKRIWHLHLKGTQCDPGLKNCQETFPDHGQIDLAGQFRALLKDGYHETMSLECEFEAPGLVHPETTRRSMQGLLKVMTAALS